MIDDVITSESFTSVKSYEKSLSNTNTLSLPKDIVMSCFLSLVNTDNSIRDEEVKEVPMDWSLGRWKVVVGEVW